MNPAVITTIFVALIALNLQAQQPSKMSDVYAAKKRIVQQLNEKNIRFSWDLLYQEKRVGDQTGLYTRNGEEIIPPQFQEIIGPPYSWLVPVRKKDSDKYSLYNLAGKELAESAYYSVVRFSNNACAVAAMDESNAACMQETYLFSLSYLCSYYLAVDSSHQLGLLNSDYERLLPFEFRKIKPAGGSRFITARKEQRNTCDLFDVETQKTLLQNVEDINVFFIKQSAPIYTGRSIYEDKVPVYGVKENGKWQLLNTDLSAVLPKAYDEVRMQDSFAIVSNDQLYEIYSHKGDLLVAETPRLITDVINTKKGFVYVTEVYENKAYHHQLLNSRQEEILSWANGSFLTKKNDIRVFARMVVSELPEKSILAFISVDARKGIFLFEDLSYEVVERKE